jgi:hypothetical protein
MARAFAGHEASGDPAQFRVNQRRQQGERLIVSARPVLQ